MIGRSGFVFIVYLGLSETQCAMCIVKPAPDPTPSTTPDHTDQFSSHFSLSPSPPSLLTWYILLYHDPDWPLLWSTNYALSRSSLLSDGEQEEEEEKEKKTGSLERGGEGEVIRTFLVVNPSTTSASSFVSGLITFLFQSYSIKQFLKD